MHVAFCVDKDVQILKIRVNIFRVLTINFYKIN
jgi:hypothetical protein